MATDYLTEQEVNALYWGNDECTSDSGRINEQLKPIFYKLLEAQFYSEFHYLQTLFHRIGPH